jgi:ABC-type glycerol-3-phosphate transport system substrate-binding protein
MEAKVHPYNKARRLRLIATGLAAVSVVALGLSGCSSSGGSGKVTITLSGPNQWNSETKTFGKAWDDLVASFEKANPDITIKTNVLPLASWAQTSAAQLTAGTAPALIFNQTPHKPEQILPLDSYLNKPDPYIKGNTKWIDAFNSTYFGGTKKLGINGVGHYESVPFNLVAVGVYFNKDILKKAGVSASDLKTFDGFTKACTAITKAGYVPLGVDNGYLVPGWTATALSSMVLHDEAVKLNQFDASGAPGTPEVIQAKSIAKGYLTGDLNLTTDPAFSSMLKVMKKYYTACATPNWSGVKSAGAFTGGTDFLSGKAAMSYGTNFSATSLGDVKFTYSTAPFPTLSKSDTKYTTGEDAQFGVSNGGTAYMIPAYIKGAERAAAVKFLQYTTSSVMQKWLDGTGGIPSQKALKTAPGLDAMLAGAWGTTPITNQGFVELPAAVANTNPFEGYLLGSATLDQALQTMQTNGIAWSKEQAANGKWTEDWATK